MGAGRQAPRLVQHIRGGFADPVRLRSRDIPRLMERCGACHQQHP